MVTLSLVWLLMEKQELWLVIAMMYLQKDNNQPTHLARTLSPIKRKLRRLTAFRQHKISR